MPPFKLHFEFDRAPPEGTPASVALVAADRKTAQLEAAIAFGNMETLPSAFWISNAAGEVVYRWSSDA